MIATTLLILATVLGGAEGYDWLPIPDDNWTEHTPLLVLSLSCAICEVEECWATWSNQKPEPVCGLDLCTECNSRYAHKLTAAQKSVVAECRKLEDVRIAANKKRQRQKRIGELEEQIQRLQCELKALKNQDHWVTELDPVTLESLPTIKNE